MSHRRVAPLPLTTKTRKTLAAVGVFWLAFAASTHAAPPAEAAPAVTPSPPSPI